ncbi:hypothetical protein POPTR_006G100800v4 [Populus trichocarpa]|uniref:FCP1 homology domain-containing protein n=1 Tax=Populus trichocarpa TaxID=3694 RepID=B9HCX1_POPTR|nr:uncharacterized protein LOC7487322 [Populus trichocarpa]KAI5584552.1 hypothetical protein BDE02_06G089200 [Populus trichocarpa]PNT30811.1 hypothetical protein POPTR_006G100800v4 [Populus trichocarpa]|eukprot:XP_002309143.2 CTD nuclear envelope phosphatase 1 homolog [Populus trichocarpa]
MMEEIGGGGGKQGGEVCVSRSVNEVWKGMMNGLGFVMKLFLQILRGTPSMAQFLLSYIGFTFPLLSSSPPSFKPLPVVEIPLQETTSNKITDKAHDSSCLPGYVCDFGASDDCLIEKLTVVLDLDETLICAYEASSLPAIIRTQAVEAGVKCFELECFSSEKDVEGKPRINYVTVFERPGLKEFLKQIGEFADLILFTAGLEGYARPLFDRIDVENQFSQRLYRPSTVSTEYREHVKDLSCLSKDLSRVVIVDNNPFSFLLQPLNGIPCVPFSARLPYDEQLLDVLLPLLKNLSLQKDVRPVLYERFHMPEWFQMHGIPASALTV